MATHEITVRSVVRPNQDWQGPAYRAYCSCGSYQSKSVGYPGHAEMAGRAHADAKNAAGAGR